MNGFPVASCPFPEKQDRRFRLGTTSFIYPDDIIPNVKRIGAVFDEIELLVFESIPEGVIPSTADVAELVCLGRDMDLSFNVHMPVDVSLVDPDAGKRKKAAETLARVVERFAPIFPTTHTLHLEMDPGEAVEEWTLRAIDGIGLLACCLPDIKVITVETLNYEPALLDPILAAYPRLGLCVDAGHHFKYGYDLGQTLERHGCRVPLIHLHGVDFTGEKPRDHIGLDRLPEKEFFKAMDRLKSYSGTVSLEVFNRENLNRSLQALSFQFTGIPGKLCE